MSYTEIHIGTATEVVIPKGKNINDVIKYIFQSRGIIIPVPSLYDTLEEALNNELNKEYFYHESSDTLYKIDDQEFDADYIDEITEVESKPKKLRYTFSFYNGGTSFHEMLDAGLDRI